MLPTPPSYTQRIPNDPFYWPGAEAYTYTNAGPVQVNVAGSGISLNYSSSVLYSTGGGGGSVSVVFPITNAGTPVAPIIGIAPATTTTQGSVELATVAETDARLSTTVAVTPASLINYFSSNLFTQRGQLLTSLAASSPTLLNPPLGIPAGCVLVTDPLTPSGLNWSSTAGAFIPCACILAKGSILTGPAAATPTALPVGVDGSVLVADSTCALGLKWSLSAGAFIPCACIVAKGTLISGAVPNVPQPLAVGLDGQVLTADSTCALGLKWASGVTPQATPILLGTVLGCTDLTNAALGCNALLTNTGACNVAVGVSALQTNSGSRNVAVGDCALLSNSGGWYNTAVGSFALQTSTGGNSYNTAIGTCSMAGGAVSGCNNTGVGGAALYNLTTGLDNSGVGTAALFSITTGSCNTGMGSNALNSVSSGRCNTAIGWGAGRNITTGCYNLALGFCVCVTSGTGNCQLAMGWDQMGVQCYWLTGNSTKAIKPGAGIIDCANSCGTAGDRKSTRLNSSHVSESRMPSSA